jgi:hypothetical protein
MDRTGISTTPICTKIISEELDKAVENYLLIKHPREQNDGKFLVFLPSKVRKR